MRKTGDIGIGQKRGRFLNGYLVIIASDQAGNIRGAEVMEGLSIIAVFKPKESIDGQQFAGNTVEGMLQHFKAMDPKRQKRFKGYIQALEALKMRMERAAADTEAEPHTAHPVRLPEAVS